MGVNTEFSKQCVLGISADPTNTAMNITQETTVWEIESILVSRAQNLICQSTEDIF